MDIRFVDLRIAATDLAAIVEALTWARDVAEARARADLGAKSSTTHSASYHERHTVLAALTLETLLQLQALKHLEATARRQLDIESVR